MAHGKAQNTAQSMAHGKAHSTARGTAHGKAESMAHARRVHGGCRHGPRSSEARRPEAAEIAARPCEVCSRWSEIPASTAGAACWQTPRRRWPSSGCDARWTSWSRCRCGPRLALEYVRLQPLLHTVAASVACSCSLDCTRLQPRLHTVAASAAWADRLRGCPARYTHGYTHHGHTHHGCTYHGCTHHGYTY